HLSRVPRNRRPRVRGVSAQRGRDRGRHSLFPSGPAAGCPACGASRGRAQTRCGKGDVMTQVQTGDVVRVHFTGWLAGGAMFGTSRDREPIEFTAGGDQVLQGMSRAVLGMAVGEKKNFTLSPEEAFGPRRPELKYQVRRSQLPEEVKVGDQ